jgi:hypothetical protein
MRAMYRQFRSRFALLAVLTCPVFGQTKSTIATSKITSAPESTASTDAAAEVLAFERAMEAAVVRGDVAYVDRVSAPDLTFTHGDGWTTGGKPLLVDDRKSFLKRVENRQYNVRDLDSVKVEMHGTSLLLTGATWPRTGRVTSISRGFRCGLSGSTRNVTTAGCMYLIELSMVQLMGRTGSR